MKFYRILSQCLILFPVFLFLAVPIIHAQQRTIPIRIEIKSSEDNDDDDDPSGREERNNPTPAPSNTPEPSPIPTPNTTPEPKPAATAVPASTPEPVVASTASPIPYVGGPISSPTPKPEGKVQLAAVPDVIQQIKKQFSNSPKNTPKVETLTPGKVITPIIPRGMLDRMIPQGLYKDDGLNPIDGLAMLIFGIGFILAGIALLRADIFLPAFSKYELFSGRKRYELRQLLRKNSNTFVHHNG